MCESDGIDKPWFLVLNRPVWLKAMN